MRTLFFYALAALAEIGGCYAFWMWWHLDRFALWLALGVAALARFARAPAHVESAVAGRAFAAYGGIYIAASLGRLWLIEGTRPDRWDVFGAALCLLGAAVILCGPRHSP